jgi:ribonuclease HI
MAAILSPSGHEVTHVYADGGCILANPSSYGGTWAYVHANPAEDRKVAGLSGIYPADRFGGPVTNNAMELLAVLKGLEALPDGWIGTVLTDSQVTITRWTGSKVAFVGIPKAWALRMRAVLARLGGTTWTQLAGHPTAEELERGYRIKTLPDGSTRAAGVTSKWQVMCDRRCSALSVEYQVRHGLAVPDAATPRTYTVGSPEPAASPFAALARLEVNP